MRAINILSTVTEVAAACDQPNRMAITLQNDSDADMFLKFDTSADALTVDNGLRLAAGAHIILESTETVSFANNTIQAIHAGSGNKVMRVQEFARDGAPLQPPAPQ
jgi:hypothetical protein